MFFIKFGAKFFRIVGIILAVLMFLVSISLVIFTAFFSSGEGSSRSAVFFGHNLYIVRSSAFEEIPGNCMAVSQSVSASSLSPEHLIVYKEFNSEKKALGKVNEVFIADGVYSCDVTDESGNNVTVSEGQLVGEVVYYSQFLGDVILFARSPLGILVMAIMPCLAIILLDLVKAIVSRLPPPEVVPVLKNPEPETQSGSSNTINIGDDGNAKYSSAKKPLAPETAQDVLFTRNKVFHHAPDTKTQYIKPSSQTVNTSAKPVAQQTEATRSKPVVSETAPKSVQNAYKKAAETTPVATTVQKAKPEVPKTSQPKNKEPDKTKSFFDSRKTSEPPVIKNPAKPKPEKQVKPIEKARDLADLEESLVYTHSKSNTEQKVHSSDVIAGMKPDALLRDDDDNMDKRRYSVDDILAGLEKK